MSEARETQDIPSRFVELIRQVTTQIVDRPVDSALEGLLHRMFPADGAWFFEMETLCRLGCVEGWLCTREQNGIRFGRPVKPGLSTHGFSVDVVEMDDIVGPHHAHPNGEIDLIMPVDPTATFDATRKGWKVYDPGSEHSPTVSGGKALILYLLPGGAIEFTRAPSA